MACFSPTNPVLVLCVLLTVLARPASATELTAHVADYIQVLTRTDFIRESRPLALELNYRFYHKRDFQPVWLAEQGINDTARRLMEVIGRADEEGMDPSAYHQSELNSLLAEAEPDNLQRARIDVLLTDAYFSYAQDVRSGRVSPRKIDPYWHIEPDSIDWFQALEQLLASPDKEVAQQLTLLPPYQSGYRRLRRELQRHTRIAAQGGWSRLHVSENLHRGVSGPAVSRLRKRLALGGDYTPSFVRDDNHGLFDVALEQALKTFQFRHGLEENGRVDEPTRKALNVPVESRLQQLRIAMERWRWLPRHLGRRYLLVNVPAYTLYAMDTGQTVFSMRVIIGKTHRQTPSILTQMTDVVLNPYWYVPKSILRKDILPRMRRNPAYLRGANIQVLSSLEEGGREIEPEKIDWQQMDAGNFPYILRQAPGSGNALGRIKFRLAESNGIYLHDTPKPQLFKRRVRAYSSGCIRLEEPLKLAQFVLDNEAQWDRSALQGVIEQGIPRRIGLTEQLPVMLVYWTTWVDDDGLLHFRDDIYGRDTLLKQAVSRMDSRTES